jgi:hypothetical protein
MVHCLGVQGRSERTKSDGCNDKFDQSFPQCVVAKYVHLLVLRNVVPTVCAMQMALTLTWSRRPIGELCKFIEDAAVLGLLRSLACKPEPLRFVFLGLTVALGLG